MISAATINMKGEMGEKMTLPKEIFEAESNPTILAQAVRVYLSNQRMAHAKTKTRTDVNKTTAKMFRQKGTGRARHGSYAAPIFVGGGVAHGPDGRQNFTRSLSKPLVKKALVGALSLRAGEKQCMVLTGSDKPISKAKDAQIIWSKTSEKPASTLIIATSAQKEITRAFRNLKHVDVVHTNQLHAYAILAHKHIVLTDLAVEELKKTHV